MTAVAAREDKAELLRTEEIDAWLQYLAATRKLSPVRYAEIEEWAWARLSQRLRAISARREKIAS